MIEKLERIKYEAIMDWLKILYCNILGGTEENSENVFQDNRCAGRGSNWHLPVHRSVFASGNY
jgi:hypothetical protein